MGKKVESQHLPFVSFGPDCSGFAASASVDLLASGGVDARQALERARIIYERRIGELRHLVCAIRKNRIERKATPARIVWRVGNAIYALRDELEVIGLQIDGMYQHLERDLQVKRKWLEKVVILRRYVSQPDFIPESLTWGRIEKGTRRACERLAEARRNPTGQ